MHSLLGLPELGDLRYNTLKMLLTNGMQFIKHSPGFGKKPHLSTIKISDNEFFYTSKQNPQVGRYPSPPHSFTHPPKYRTRPFSDI